MVDLICCIYSGWFCSETTTKMNSNDTKAKAEVEGKSRFSGFMHHFKQYKSPLTTVVVDFYSPFLQNYIVKIVVIVVFTILFGVCVWGCTTVEDGLDVDDVIPEGTVEHSFASANIRHFAAYTFTIVTKDLDYEKREVQKALLQMNKEVRTARYIVDAGGLTSYWLDAMIKFFDRIQTFYDERFCPVIIRAAGLSSPPNMTIIQGAIFQANILDFTRIFVRIQRYFGAPVNDTAGVALVIQNCLMNKTLLRPLVEKEGGDVYLPEDRFYQYIPLWVSVYKGILYVFEFII